MPWEENKPCMPHTISTPFPFEKVEKKEKFFPFFSPPKMSCSILVVREEWVGFGWVVGVTRVLVICVCCPLHSGSHSTSSLLESGSRITNIRIPVLLPLLWHNKAPSSLNTYAEKRDGRSSLPILCCLCHIFVALKSL